MNNLEGSNLLKQTRMRTILNMLLRLSASPQQTVYSFGYQHASLLAKKDVIKSTCNVFVTKLACHVTPAIKVCSIAHPLNAAQLSESKAIDPTQAIGTISNPKIKQTTDLNQLSKLYKLYTPLQLSNSSTAVYYERKTNTAYAYDVNFCHGSGIRADISPLRSGSNALFIVSGSATSADDVIIIYGMGTLNGRSVDLAISSDGASVERGNVYHYGLYYDDTKTIVDQPITFELQNENSEGSAFSVDRSDQASSVYPYGSSTNVTGVYYFGDNSRAILNSYGKYNTISPSIYSYSANDGDTLISLTKASMCIGVNMRNTIADAVNNNGNIFDTTSFEQKELIALQNTDASDGASFSNDDISNYNTITHTDPVNIIQRHGRYRRFIHILTNGPAIVGITNQNIRYNIINTQNTIDLKRIIATHPHFINIFSYIHQFAHPLNAAQLSESKITAPRGTVNNPILNNGTLTSALEYNTKYNQTAKNLSSNGISKTTSYSDTTGQNNNANVDYRYTRNLPHTGPVDITYYYTTINGRDVDMASTVGTTGHHPVVHKALYWHDNHQLVEQPVVFKAYAYDYYGNVSDATASVLFPLNSEKYTSNIIGVGVYSGGSNDAVGISTAARKTQTSNGFPVIYSPNSAGVVSGNRFDGGIDNTITYVSLAKASLTYIVNDGSMLLYNAKNIPTLHDFESIEQNALEQCSYDSAKLVSNNDPNNDNIDRAYGDRYYDSSYFITDGPAVFGTNIPVTQSVNYNIVNTLLSILKIIIKFHFKHKHRKYR